MTSAFHERNMLLSALEEKRGPSIATQVPVVWYFTPIEERILIKDFLVSSQNAGYIGKWQTPSISVPS
jgi:hypothetical protein